MTQSNAVAGDSSNLNTVENGGTQGGNFSQSILNSPIFNFPGKPSEKSDKCKRWPRCPLVCVVYIHIIYLGTSFIF